MRQHGGELWPLANALEAALRHQRWMLILQAANSQSPGWSKAEHARPDQRHLRLGEALAGWAREQPSVASPLSPGLASRRFKAGGLN